MHYYLGTKVLHQLRILAQMVLDHQVILLHLQWMDIGHMHSSIK